MYPYIHFFGRTIASYGFMCVIGCFAALGCALLGCRRQKATLDNMFYMFVFIFFCALIGAKLLYLIPHISDFWVYRDFIFASIQNFGQYIGSGFVFYGGLIGGIFGPILYAHFFKEDAFPLVQAFVPAIPLFHCIGRIGCFLAGCCYGIEYHGALAVTFTNAVGGAPNGVPLLPVQLIEAGANLITFIILIIYNHKPRKPLQPFGLYLMIYGVERFIFEFFRGDLIRGGLLGLSTSQWISLLLVPLGIWLFIVKPEKNWLAVKGLRHEAN